MAKNFLQPATPENSEGLRRMVAGWQAVERQEREERRKAGPDAAMAIQGALELMDLFGAMHGWPPPENEARRRDNELARRQWVRVRSFTRPMAKRPSKRILEALADLAKALRRIDAPSMVIGGIGIAVIAHVDMCSLPDRRPRGPASPGRGSR